jgi:pyruvate formate lyase activating enzyme
MKEALLYERLPGGRVRCYLCAHRCLLLPGRTGICHVRRNVDGTLYTLAYGRTAAQEIDPIEKKPLFHFYPGSTAYSIATVGCNFHCLFCQNWLISQPFLPQDFVAGNDAPPEQIVHRALRSRCRSIAYTYTEPTVFFEYALDTARLAHSRGLANVFVTNGYETPEAVEMIRPYLDAANVDLKGFRDRYYRKVVGAKLQPVLDTILLFKKLGVWVEVTTLVIPGHNDSFDELRSIARFLAREAGTDTPWHLSRFFPAHRMPEVPPTSVSALLRAREIGLEEGLEYVYVGNVRETEWSNTYCPGCSALLIERTGYVITINRIEDGKCPDCRCVIAGIGLDQRAGGHLARTVHGLPERETQ